MDHFTYSHVCLSTSLSLAMGQQEWELPSRLRDWQNVEYSLICHKPDEDEYL